MSEEEENNAQQPSTPPKKTGKLAQLGAMADAALDRVPTWALWAGLAAAAVVVIVLR